MKKPIIILYAKRGEDSTIAELLNSIITETGIYESTVMSKTEHEASLFKQELAGQVIPCKLILIGNIEAVPVDKITWHYNELGMKYGWNKNFAILQTKKKKWTEKELEELLNLFKQSDAASKESDDAKGLEKVVNKIIKKTNELPTGVKAAITTIATGNIFLFGLWGATAVAAYLINGKINDDKVFENQQKYLAWKFCTMGLEKFMEDKK
jgi:hypothetical protein